MKLIDAFELSARASAATVERVPRSGAAIAAAVRRIVAEAKRIAVAEPQVLPPELFVECRQLPGVFQRRTKQELASADVGVTDAFAGVARTGSICIGVDQEYAGYISLLSRLHVAVLPAECIVERPSDLFAENRAGLRRNFVFITGPSATADMGPLVRGVHGPHRLHILLLEAP